MNTHSIVTFTQHSRDTEAVWAWEEGRVINRVVSWAQRWGGGQLPVPAGLGTFLSTNSLSLGTSTAFSHLTTPDPPASWGPTRDSPGLICL